MSHVMSSDFCLRFVSFLQDDPSRRRLPPTAPTVLVTVLVDPSRRFRHSDSRISGVARQRYCTEPGPCCHGVSEPTRTVRNAEFTSKQTCVTIGWLISLRLTPSEACLWFPRLRWTGPRDTGGRP